ncbi:Inner membrane protein YfdC [Rhodobacteraceae bacterium THAF1]|uniref:formate/nitrite transporter family protein n=1 Tax=Palleronia sp. THAF1 TaxID=2587842 RepID=UPI000F3ACF8C|nr:formate/nitrite transporter family protein [Palleronia sp. THAF1]QFU10215.1 Inner membrane protein YfdC [Palleronia sp. THAF1]VDC16880.1 Inner membrane protein YfdC [Rhodobacteraceae bacterium THAF1]
MVSRDEERLRAKDINRQQEAEQNMDGEERESVEQASRLSARLIYEVIRRDGADEMTRPKTSLVFSGLAAGILISFSVLGEAILQVGLPDTAWRPLVESFGYTLGFLLVIMGRMQLFTENTITTVLPLTSQPCKEYFYLTGRLWAIVLTANVIGAFIAAAFMAYTGAFGPDIQMALTEISEKAILHPPLEGFAKAIPAGVIVAAIVWMLPTVPQGGFLLIFTFTWLIAAGGFTHIIAGSVEMAYLVLTGVIGWAESLRFFFPVLLGNVFGGTAVFTLITWAQVAAEVDE